MDDNRNVKGQFAKRPFSWETVLQRFYPKFKDNGCWEWQGALNKGYGKFSFKGKAVEAHRLSYEIFIGEIPEGYQLDHLCRNTKCVNPYHLEPVLPIENIRRSDAGMFWSAKTHCPAGHEYTPENTGTNKSGSRWCRSCHRLVANLARSKRRAEAMA